MYDSLYVVRGIAGTLYRVQVEGSIAKLLLLLLRTEDFSYLEVFFNCLKNPTTFNKSGLDVNSVFNFCLQFLLKTFLALINIWQITVNIKDETYWF